MAGMVMQEHGIDTVMASGPVAQEHRITRGMNKA
jgi:hypothetical protein